MIISFILSSLLLSGGVRVVVQYANRLTKRGHQVSLIIPNGTIDPEIKQEIDPVIQIIETKSALGSRMNVFRLIRLCWEMANCIPQSDVIIATHTPTTAVSLIATKLLNRGKIIWYYMDYQEMFDERPIERWLLRNALRWHDYAITLSDACVQELHSFCPGKIINIGLGIDTINTYHPIPNPIKINDGNPEKKVIFFLGDSRPRKGMTDFLQAADKVFASETNLVLWIASKEKTNIQTNVPYMVFIRPTDNELARLYSACDVFVSASWYEGFGLPPLEAMACGAAVVTTDSRGIQEFAVDGGNCLIVPPRNPDGLANAILLLLSKPELSDKLRKNGPITASKFDWNHATDRFEAALLLSDAKIQAIQN
jgi:glycosyltransferase involved in cell wall biosynthesis